LTNNSGRKPLWLLGEASVIIVSILLAFAIDAAWAQRQLRTEEREALVALEAEFTANLDQVKSVIGVHIANREHVRRLVELPDDSVAALPQREVSQIMLATGGLTTFDPVLGTTDALVGAGKLGVLRDSRLREALTTFDNYVLDAEDDGDFMWSFAPEIWKAQIRWGGPWYDPLTEVGTAGAVEGLGFLPQATAEDLLQVRTDRELMGLINWYHLNVGYYLVELQRIRDHISTVLLLIGESRDGRAF